MGSANGKRGKIGQPSDDNLRRLYPGRRNNSTEELRTIDAYHRLTLAHYFHVSTMFQRNRGLEQCIELFREHMAEIGLDDLIPEDFQDLVASSCMEFQ